VAVQIDYLAHPGPVAGGHALLPGVESLQWRHRRRALSLEHESGWGSQRTTSGVAGGATATVSGNTYQRDRRAATYLQRRTWGPLCAGRWTLRSGESAAREATRRVDLVTEYSCPHPGIPDHDPIDVVDAGIEDAHTHQFAAVRDGADDW